MAALVLLGAFVLTDRVLEKRAQRRALRRDLDDDRYRDLQLATARRLAGLHDDDDDEDVTKKEEEEREEVGDGSPPPPRYASKPGAGERRIGVSATGAGVDRRGEGSAAAAVSNEKTSKRSRWRAAIGRRS